MDSREPCFEAEIDEVFVDNCVLSRGSTSGRTVTVIEPSKFDQQMEDH